MSQIAATMPEAKFRSTKKRVSLRTSEFAHEARTFRALTAKLETPAKAQAQAEAKPAAKAEKKSKEESSWFAWWPVAVGLFLTGFAPEWFAMASQAGIWVLRAAFPLALLATQHQPGVDLQTTSMMPQLALYAQIPLEGLLTKLTLDRGKSLKAAAVQLVLVHAVSAFVLWLITFAGN